MMVNAVFLLGVLLLTPAFAISFGSSSSESCEDDHGHHGGGGHRNGGCDHGWKRFNRPTGGWCIRVFEGKLSRPNAESQCRSYGATLSGLQNFEETKYITSSALRVVTYQPTTSVWIGAQRSSACSRQGLTASCNPQTSFHWTDSSTTGTAGFVWDRNQPDNAHTLTQNCAILLASPNASVLVGQITWQANYLDDVDCDLVASALSPRAVFAYVCGKEPRRN